MKESRDILTLFEQLNSHEVFTPPRVAREMLALLPKDIWCDPSIRILDPCVKSGVFLREALYLLIDGLAGKGKHVGHDGVEYDLNDGRQRMNHILKNMLFGIATSELTGYISRRTLYGVMEANTDKQTALIDAFEKSKSHKKWTEEEKVRFLVRNHFNEYYDHGLFNAPDYAGFEHEGNIFYPTAEVNKKVDDSDAFIIEDTYYPFIEEQVNHGKIQKIKDGQMKFDVVIGNPPYQVSTNQSGSQAKPIYQNFVNMAKSISPKFVSFIIPARWYAGGMGLDTFRTSMLFEEGVSRLVDFRDPTTCFPGVDIQGGVCYFLWEKDFNGKCLVVNNSKGVVTEDYRKLSSFDVFIRDNIDAAIVSKVTNGHGFSSVKENMLPSNPFGIGTNFSEYFEGKRDGSLKVYMRGMKEVWVQRDKIRDDHLALDKWKILVPLAYGERGDYPHFITGKPFIAEPGTACSMTYSVCSSFESEQDAINFLKYFKTKFFRFLISTRKNTQHLTRDRFSFVPFDPQCENISDEKLYVKYGLSDVEILRVESVIKVME